MHIASSWQWRALGRTYVKRATNTANKMYEIQDILGQCILIGHSSTKWRSIRRVHRVFESVEHWVVVSSFPAHSMQAAGAHANMAHVHNETNTCVKHTYLRKLDGRPATESREPASILQRFFKTPQIVQNDRIIAPISAINIRKLNLNR
jgi:hypothetical protein